MKKVITIFLILLFTVNEFSFITVYLPLKNLATLMQKAKVENCDTSNDFALIVMKESDLNNDTSSSKFNDESEFMFNGELYDVINMEVKDGNVYIYCIKDETENLLDKSFKLHFDNIHNNKFSLTFFNHTVAKKLLPFVFADDIIFDISQIENVLINNVNLNLKPFIDKVIPPPKIS
jgi:hypothetical protein